MINDKRPKWFYFVSINLIFTTVIYLYYSTNILDDKRSTFRPLLVASSDEDQNVTPPGYFVYSDECKIAELNIIDEHISKYFEHVDSNGLCDKWNHGKPRLVGANRTFLFVIKSSIKYYYKGNSTNIKCYYRPFTWKYVQTYKYGTINAKYGKTHILISPIEVTENDFIKVQCFLNKLNIYTDFFSFVPLNRPYESKHLITNQHDSDSTNENQYSRSGTNENQYSVLIVGIDAVSRMNFLRQMPKSYKYLSTSSSFDFIDFKGYNKVGDNTFPNLIAILAGMSEKELINSCWPNPESNFDECPFIWKKFNTIGYKTLFAEDSFLMSTFNYIKSGFKYSPTDYYYNIFSKESENIIGNNKLLNSYLCIGSQLIFKTILEYTLKFTTTLKEHLYFGFVWTVSLTHDFINLPKLGDTILLNFIKTLTKNNNLNNTILILTSDHGLRWGAFRETYQGHLEERLPLLFFILPNHFKLNYKAAYKNLIYNQNKLSTPFDLHETLKDILNIKRIDNKIIQINNHNYSNVQNISSTRGISLFNKISINRNCESAGIPVHYCTCHDKLINISNTSRTVIDLSTRLINHINNVLLKKYKEICSKLKLYQILSAQYGEAISSVITGTHKNRTQRDYVISVMTVPGLATFESTIRYDEVTNVTDIIGDVSRINLYSNQSRCVDDFKAKLYCFCK